MKPRFLFVALISTVMFCTNAFADVNEGLKHLKAWREVEAFDEFKIAAEQGDSLGQYHLARMLANKHGSPFQKIPYDREKANYWFKKAADKGHMEAQIELGEAYWLGFGFPQNIKQSIYWYSKAGEQGHLETQLQLAFIYQSSSPDIKDLRKSAYWYKKAANQGSTRAQVELSNFYEKGEGVPQDFKKSDFWMRKAAEKNDPSAILFLGLRYAIGDSLPRNMTIAYALFNMSNTLDPSKENGAAKLRDDTTKFMTRSQIKAGQELTHKLMAKGRFQSELNKAMKTK